MAVVKHVLELDRYSLSENVTAFDVLGDEEITAAAKADPDNPPLTEDELARLVIARRVKQVRTALKLSQESFSGRYGIPVATLRQWELGRRLPDRANLSYLQVIAALPEEVASALEAGAR